MRVVIDTNILISAIMSRENLCRRIIGLAFDREIFPVVGQALFSEYEDVISRDYLFERGPFDRQKREMFLDDFLSACDWVTVHYLWRPNLRDEADNHVLELAVAAGASHVVTQNIKDFRFMDMHMPGITVMPPLEFYETWRTKSWQH